ncbi:sensor histidine kinase [Azohydromonas aeria]|uniref:sensor histidine kinase n=1 Tax=Azohydromonas aeria TaxID=2590212 RepID=UPI0012F798AB|nr:histidine kinase dimerization/phospho-acceptor domain-containing protein [Azohydromonas aeria]
MDGLVGMAVLALALLVALLALARALGREQALRQRLRESEQRAQAADETRTRFLRTMSHELRTPLNGILGYAELIRDTSTDPEAREFGGIVHHSAEQLHALLGTLLDLARIEAGRLGLQLETVALPALLHEITAMHRATAEARALALRLDIAPRACDATLVTDRSRLAQVLNHLLTNALKFTERGGVSLALDAEPEAVGVRIEVRDSGIGMSAAQLGALRSPPAAGAAAADYVHRAQGPGLGLPLARELTALLGGELLIESVPGQGTCALLRLPLAAPAAAARTQAQAQTRIANTTPNANANANTTTPEGARPGAAGRVQGNDQ